MRFIIFLWLFWFTPLSFATTTTDCQSSIAILDGQSLYLPNIDVPVAPLDGMEIFGIKRVAVFAITLDVSDKNELRMIESNFKSLANDFAPQGYSACHARFIDDCGSKTRVSIPFLMIKGEQQPYKATIEINADNSFEVLEFETR